MRVWKGLLRQQSFVFRISDRYANQVVHRSSVTACSFGVWSTLRIDAICPVLSDVDGCIPLLVLTLSHVPISRLLIIVLLLIS